MESVIKIERITEDVNIIANNSYQPVPESLAMSAQCADMQTSLRGATVAYSECPLKYQIGMVNLKTNNTKMETPRYANRKRRCNTCKGCRIENCGQCTACKNPKLKKACMERKCIDINPTSPLNIVQQIPLLEVTKKSPETKLSFKIRKCEFCTQAFPNNITLDRHYSNMHPEALRCSFCSYSSKSRDKMLNHSNVVHSQIKNYKCDACPKEFGYRRNLDRHKLVHDTSNHPKLPIFDVKKRSAKTKFSHKVSKCKFCNQAFPKASDLNHHYKSVHQEGLSCNLCNYKSNRRNRVIQHIGVVHNQIKPYKCHACPKEFAYKRSLKTHLLGYHEANGRIKCPECSYTNPIQYNVQQHIKYHHKNVISFQCALCKYTAITKAKLKRHVRMIHDRVKEELCDICPATFATKHNLKVHIKLVHMKIKEFKCFACTFQSHRSSRLRAHITSRHLQEEATNCLSILPGVDTIQKKSAYPSLQTCNVYLKRNIQLDSIALFVQKSL